MFVAEISSLNFAWAILTLDPTALVNEPEPAVGKLPVYWFLGIPALLKYPGVGVFTWETYT